MFDLPIDYQRFKITNTGEVPVYLHGAGVEPKGYGGGWIIPAGESVEIYGNMRFFNQLTRQMGRLWFLGGAAENISVTAL